MAQAPLPPAPDSSKCPGVQESVAKILCARRWVAAYGVCEVEGVFWGFFPLGKSWNAQRFQQGEHRQNGKKSIFVLEPFSLGQPCKTQRFQEGKNSKPIGNQILFTTSARRRHIAISSSSVTIISALVSAFNSAGRRTCSICCVSALVLQDTKNLEDLFPKHVHLRKLRTEIIYHECKEKRHRIQAC